jgi:hypothetical protein
MVNSVEEIPCIHKNQSVWYSVVTVQREELWPSFRQEEYTF